jgi:hypothetical protein
MRWLPILGSGLLLSGCATSALWEEGRFARFHEPTPPSNLQIAYAAPVQDFLIEYDEACDDDSPIRRRAYFLQRNAARLQARRRPRFTNPAKLTSLTPVPLFDSPETANLRARTQFHAVAFTNQTFTLYSHGMKLGTYELPVYADASGRTKQVLLTPVAVTADLTIIGGFLFLWAWSEGALYCIH